MLLKEITTIVESITVYHGSAKNFDRFDANKIGTASGLDKGGWGFYFSTSREVSQDYAPGDGVVKKFTIPSGEYFKFDGADDSMIDAIYSEFQDLEMDEDEMEEHLEDYRSEYMDDASYRASTDNEMLYTWLSYALGTSRNERASDSRKAASMFLAGMGYVGTTFKDKSHPEASNYVIFDPDDIRLYRGD